MFQNVKQMNSHLPHKWRVLVKTLRNEFLALLLFTEKNNIIAFWGKIFKDFQWDLCGRKSSQRQIDITKYSALIQSRWSGKLAASSQGCHFLTCTVWDCLRFLTTLKSNPPVDSSQWQQGVQGKGTVSSWAGGLLNTFLFLTDSRFPFLGTILPAQTHSEVASLSLLDNFYKQMWGQRFQGKSTFLHFLYSQHLPLFGVLLINLFAKNRKTVPHLEVLR